jgi:hypothetical protein
MYYNIILPLPYGGLGSLLHHFFTTIIDIEKVISPVQYRLLLPIFCNQKDHHGRDFNIFDKIFNYDVEIEHFKELNENIIYTTNFLMIYRSVYFEKTRELSKKIKFNDTINNSVEYLSNLFGLDKNSLAVHLRFTDMISIHPEYGIFLLKDYFDKIVKVLENNKSIQNIYIASDNKEKLNDLKQLLIDYNNNIKVFYFDNPYRIDKDDAKENWNSQYININNIDFYNNILIETLLISRCGVFIFRISDIANTAIIFSDTLNNLIEL